MNDAFLNKFVKHGRGQFRKISVPPDKGNECGIISDYGNELFGPGDNIIRERLAVMLWRYAGAPAAISKELRFNDTNEVSSYAVDAFCRATENDIINGKGGSILAPSASPLASRPRRCS